jgi:cobalt/nickel transport system permease protein
MGNGFIERTLESFACTMARVLESEQLAKANGLLQSLDPRVKLVCLPWLIVAAVIAHKLQAVIAVFAAGVLVAVLSRIPVGRLAARVWLPLLVFTGVIAFPALFITPGTEILAIPLLHWPLTAPGVRSFALLVCRVETAATLCILLVLSTPWTHLLKALRVVRVPVVVVVILGMTHRYIYLLLETAGTMFLARRSRLTGQLAGRDARALAAGIGGALMSRTLQLSSDVYLAMQSRGFAGEIHLLSRFAMQPRDYLAMLALMSAGIIAFWFGR